MTTAIRVQNLSKAYRITAARSGASQYRTLTEEITRLFRRRAEPKNRTFWALDDVQFEIQEGEAVGIIGRNGAGKSTLLKILSRIARPTKGRAEIYGRVGSLLEVGTGFHQELTGRENVFLNGAILGMSRSEIKRRFDDIVSFAEVEQFLDIPVKRYSSGMYMRLAFAVAAHLEPEILIVDEVLAVGDVAFQKKCLDKMDDVSSSGRTVLFVSHNMQAISRLCSRCLLMQDGKLMLDGATHEVIARYFQGDMQNTMHKVWDDLAAAPGDEVVRLRCVSLLDNTGKTNDTIKISQPFRVEIGFDVLEPGKVLLPSCRFVNQSGVIIFQTTDWNPKPYDQTGRYTASVEVPGHLLAEGAYTIMVAITTPSPLAKRVYERDVMLMQIVEDFEDNPMRELWGGNDPGVVRPLLPWKVIP